MEPFLDNQEPVNQKKSVFQILKEEILELRWRVLIFVCLLTFGSYYVYDFPGSLGSGGTASIGERFNKHGKKYTQEMNQLLYSVYSWPNTVLAIFGGILMDKFLGIRISMIVFTALIFFGSVFFWLGVYFVEYPLMLTSRIIFGIGGESLSVAQSAYLARWFKGSRGMALAFGITLSFARVGSSFNFLFSPKIAEAKGVDFAALVGVFTCLISLVSCIVLTVADIHAVRIGYICPEPHLAKSTVMRFSDLLKLPLSFWSLVVICVFCYCSILPFLGIASNFFEVKYNLSTSQASSYVSAYQFTSVAGCPITGLVIDRVGRETLWLIFSSAAFIMFHLLLAYTMIPALASTIMMGLFYSVLVSSLWPLVPWVVNENVLGVSYGVMTALQNTGMAVFPIIVGNVLDRFTPQANTAEMANALLSEGKSVVNKLPSLQGYVYTELLFVGAAFVSLVASVALLIFDLRGDVIFTASGDKRKKMQAENEKASCDPENKYNEIVTEIS